MTIKVVVWGENVHERSNDIVRRTYPNGMHSCIAETLGEDPFITCMTATLQEEEHGLNQNILDNTDVLLWWGHAAHGLVDDLIVDRIQSRILEGMGLIVLHSGHYSKIFKRLMGTTCSLIWREAGELERIWVCNPAHPISNGLSRYFEIPQSEMYGEPFQIPNPEETIFTSWFQGGETFRSGLTFKRGNGKIFYFSPGHETYPIYHQEEIKLILKNSVKWAKPEKAIWLDNYTKKYSKPIEKIEERGSKIHSKDSTGFS